MPGLASHNAHTFPLPGRVQHGRGAWNPPFHPIDAERQSAPGERIQTSFAPLTHSVSRAPEECNLVQERARSVVIESCALPACHI